MEFREIDLNVDPFTANAVGMVHDAFYSDSITADIGIPFLHKVMSERAKSYCIESDNKLIAVGSFNLVSLDWKIAHITNLVIERTMRGQGFGAMILSSMEAEAKNLGCFAAELRPHFDTEVFYIKQGYEVSEKDARLYKKFL